mgnify:CR=1 FL=1
MQRPRQWERYEREGVIPKQGLITQVEETFPNTEKWLHLDLWLVTRPTPPTANQLVQVIGSVRPKLTNYVKYKLDLPLENAKTSICLPRTIDSLWKQGDLPALTTLIALIRVAEIANDNELYIDSAMACIHVMISVLSHNPMFSVRNEFFSYIENSFLQHTPDKKHYFFEKPVDLKQSIDTLNSAIEGARYFGIIDNTNKQTGKLYYWLWREGLVNDGVTGFHLLTQTKKNELAKKIKTSINSDSRALARYRSFLTRIRMDLILENGL